MKSRLGSFLFIIACSTGYLWAMKLKKSPHEKIAIKIEKIESIITKNRRQIKIPYAPVRALAFNHDGLYLAIATQEEIAVGQKITRVPVATIVENIEVVSGSLSEIGRQIYKDVPTVATRIDGIIRILNIEKFEEGADAVNAQEKVLRGHTRAITSLIFNPLANLLISSSQDKSIKLWDISRGIELGTMVIGRSPLTSLAVNQASPQEVVVGSADKNVYIVDTQTQTILNTIRGHSDRVTAVSVSSDGAMIASGSYDKSIRISDQNGAPKKILSEVCPVESVLFNPHNNLQLLSGGWGKMVHRWNPNTGKDEILYTQKHTIFSIAYSLDGKYIAVGSRYEIPSPQGVQASQPRQTEPLCVGAPGTIEIPLRVLIRMQSDILAIELPGHEADVHSVVFSPKSGKLASASIDGTVFLWNIPGIVTEIERLYRDHK